MGLIALAILLALAGTAPALESDPTVSIRGFKFRPDTVVVSAGDTVAWRNEDDIEHTVTGDAPSSSGARLDGTLAGKGTTFRAALVKPGIQSYHCERHQFTKATVRVTSPGEDQ